MDFQIRLDVLVALLMLNMVQSQIPKKRNKFTKVVVKTKNALQVINCDLMNLNIIATHFKVLRLVVRPVGCVGLEDRSLLK